MILCPGCGSGMRFDPAKKMLVCDACGGTGDPNASDNSVMAQFTGSVYTCPQCGGEIFSDSDTALTFCSYCGASVMLEKREVMMEPVSSIIPFSITKDKCKELYRKQIDKALYAPSYMKEEAQTEKIRGIYMPYWLYDYEYDGNLVYSGQTSRRSGDYIITTHYGIYINAGIDYKGTGFDAASNFSDVYSEAIAPYAMRDLVPFAEGYMAGFYADNADVNDNVYQAKACTAVGNDIFDYINSTHPELRRIGLSDPTNSASQVINCGNKSRAYMPVWFLANRHEGRVSYAVINGQTGKVAIDIPIDFKKYLLGSLIMALPIFLILQLFLTLKPSHMTVAAILFAIVSLIITNRQLNRIYTRDHMYDDDGYMTANNIHVPASENRAQNGQTKAVPKKKVTNGTTLPAVILGIVLIEIGSASENMMFFFIGFVAMMYGIVVSSIVNSSNGTVKKAGSKASEVLYIQPFKEKMKTFIRPAIAIVLGALLLIINPFMDSVYYIGAMAIMVLVLTSFFDIVVLHNRLTSRLPKQFGKRGGDENCEI